LRSRGCGGFVLVHAIRLVSGLVVALQLLVLGVLFAQGILVLALFFLHVGWSFSLGQAGLHEIVALCRFELCGLGRTFAALQCECRHGDGGQQHTSQGDTLHAILLRKIRSMD
jgi:hypothetical protein